VAYELCVDATGAVEALLEREDDHHAANSLLHPAEPLALPRPELGADEVEDWDVELLELAGQTEVYIGEVDEDGDVRAALLYGAYKAAKFAIDMRCMADDLGYAHVSDIFGADDAGEAGVVHLLAAKAKKSCLWEAGAEFADELGSVVVAAGFACREEDKRVGCGGDETSVDFSGGDCMAGSAARRFRAVLEPLEGGLGWVVARLPFNVGTTWKKMVRLRVKVEVGGEVFRTSLFADAGRGGHFVLVNKKMQKVAGARVGAMVDLTIAPDLEEREAVVPPELEKVLKSEKVLARWFAGLSESHRWEIARWINGVKSAEARQRRSEQMAERLMLTMESEKVLPPILEVAFQRSPEALRGWKAMTITQRRVHLLGVFHYQSPEAREKRVRKLVEDALRLASK